MIDGTTRRTEQGGLQVFVGGMLLDPALSQKLYNHSPNGFAWGYNGSGPAQLALALLLHFSTKEFALQYYQQFKNEVIAELPYGAWRMPERKVKAWIKKLLTDQ